MKKIITLSLCVIVTFANDIDILTNTKQQIIDLKQKQIDKKEHSNKYDWIDGATINGSVTKDNDDIQNDNYYISISQDIYRFGGISSQIDYANELKRMEEISLDISTKDDLSTLYLLLLEIKLNDISLEQNRLNIKNSLIEIEDKKSEYKAGEIGISDLNEALMTKNELQDTTKTLQLVKLKNIASVKKYTTRNYKSISIPNLELMSKDIFLENSSSIQYAKADIEVNNTLYKIKKSDYLPTLSTNAKYGYEKSDVMDGDNYYNYGLSISIPLSYTSSSNIEQTKIDYLISNQELNNKVRDAKLTYEQALFTIQNYKERIDLALEDIQLYNELLEVNEDEYKAGYKSINDVEALKNSKVIRELDIKNYKLNISKEIISLYYQL